MINHLTPPVHSIYRGNLHFAISNAEAEISARTDLDYSPWIAKQFTSATFMLESECDLHFFLLSLIFIAIREVVLEHLLGVYFISLEYPKIWNKKIM